MRAQRVLRIFLASPSDLLRCETHVTPGVGTDAQAVVSDQIGTDYDLLLGILWSRLGTPTPRFASGTVEEVRGAITTYRSSGSSPQVMMYLKTLPPPDHPTLEAEAVLRFVAELQSEGLFVWRFRTTDDFRNATRIHLSRFIQRSAALQSKGWSASTAAPPAPLAQVLDSLPTTLDEALASADAGILSASGIVAILARYSDHMNTTSAALRRWNQPGFRQRPGGWQAIVRPFIVQMEQFAAELAAETASLFGHYTAFIRGFGRVLSVAAPFHPLPSALCSPLAGTLTQVATMRAALTEMRNAETEFHEVLASWRRLEPSFDAAKRLALGSIDDFDVQVTSALQLTRELERTIEEFLGP